MLFETKTRVCVAKTRPSVNRRGLLVGLLMMASSPAWATDGLRVQGRVIDAHSGQPIVGAYVKVARAERPVSTGSWFGQSGAGIAHVEASDGRFTIDRVAPGEVRLEAAATGYRFAWVGGVRVAPEGPSVDVEIALEPYVLASLVARLTNGAGKPVSGAVVSLTPALSEPLPWLRREATSGADGRVRYAAVPAGDARMNVRASNLLRGTTRRLWLAEAEEHHVDLTITPWVRKNADLAGRVVDAGGRGIGEVVIRCARDALEPVIESRTTMNDGRFRIVLVPGVLHTLTFEKAGYLPLTRQLSLDPGRHDEEWILHPAPDLPGPNLEAEAVPGAQVTGQVDFGARPLRGARVELIPQDPERRTVKVAMTTAGGSFVHHRIPPGRYEMQVFHPSRWRIHQRMVAVDGPDHLVVEAQGAKLRGRVVDGLTGVGIAEATIRIAPGEGLEPTAISEKRLPCRRGMTATIASLADGRFEIGPLQPGQWRLMVEREGYGTRQVDHVAMGVDRQEIEIALETTTGLEVDITSMLGEIPERVRLSLHQGDRCQAVAKTSMMRLGRSSHFDWGLAPRGTWWLTVVSASGAAATVPVEIPGPPAQVVLPPAGFLRIEAPAFADDAGARLVLVGADERPAQGFSRTLTAAASFPPDKTGRFSAWGVPPGYYRAEVTSSDGRVLTGTVLVEVEKGTRFVLQ